jgi:hypothetical protein
MKDIALSEFSLKAYQAIDAEGGFAPLSIDRFGLWPKRCNTLPRTELTHP